MRNWLIIYNIIFLLSGNILFSSIHFLEEHTIHSETQECLDCMIFENSSNYILTTNLSFSSTNILNQFILIELSIVDLNFNAHFLSRAPPLFLL